MWPLDKFQTICCSGRCPEWSSCSGPHFTSHLPNPQRKYLQLQDENKTDTASTCHMCCSLFSTVFRVHPSEPNLLNITPQKNKKPWIPSSLKITYSEVSTLKSTQLKDSFSKELQPIAYTPGDWRKPLQNPSPSSSCTTNITNENSLKIAWSRFSFSTD